MVDAVISVHIDEEALRSSLSRLREAAFDADMAGVMKRAVNAVNDCLEVNARFGEYRSGKFTDHN